MTHEQFLKLMNDAINRGEYVLDSNNEGWVTWMEKLINGLREELGKISPDEFLMNTSIYLDKFDLYFGVPPVKREVQETL